MKTILSGKENRTEIKKLAQVDTNHLFDSELEREFVGAFEKLSTAERPIRIHKTLVNEKEGYSLQVGESLWTIEPQVDFDASMGISVKSRPDFVIRPKRTTGNQKPIAVFTDGYYYHKDIVDCIFIHCNATKNERECVYKLAQNRNVPIKELDFGNMSKNICLKRT